MKPLHMLDTRHPHFQAFRERMLAGEYEKRDGGDAPTAAELKTAIDKIGEAVTKARETNEQRLKQLEERGAADVVTTEELKKITDEIVELKKSREEIEELRKKMGRPGSGARGGEEVSPEAVEHRTAFLGFMRNPESPEWRARMLKADEAARKAADAEPIEQRAVATTTDAAGGHAVPELIARKIEKELLEISPLRNLVTVVQAGSKDFKQLVDINGMAYGWVGETDARAETGTPALAEVAPTFGTIYAYPKATEESLVDMFFNVENWLADSARDAFAAGEENAIVNGNGTNKPTGFLNGAPVVTADGARAFGVLQFLATGQAADWAAADEVDTFRSLIYQLKKGYRSNARWLMNKATAGEIMLFKDGDGNYLWQTSALEGQPDRFVGYPVAESEEMPDKAANAFPVAFGDFKAGYLLCDLVGLRMTRDEVTTPGYVKWYIRRRLGGKVLKSEAIKLIKIAA